MSRRNRNKMMSLLGLVVLAVLLVLFVGTVSVSGADIPKKEKMVTAVYVEYGDTLWEIAEEYYTEDWKNVSEYVEEIKRCNQLWEDDIQAGATLIVPYYEEG